MSDSGVLPESPRICCFTAPVSSELKSYQPFIFYASIILTVLLILMFYLFYLSQRQIRELQSSDTHQEDDRLSTCEKGLRKEHRDLLPIIVFNESFSVKETLCSVCLGDYKAEDRLQQMPGCGHTFHVLCIDCWLSNHTTCPLCRLSLFTKSTIRFKPSDDADNEIRPSDDSENGVSNTENRVVVST